MDEERRAKERARHDEFVASMLRTLHQEFATLIQEHLAAKAQHNEAIQPYERKPTYLECVIRPSSMADQPVIDSLASCRSILGACQIGPVEAPFPDLRHSKQTPGQDGVEGRLNNYGLECWHLSERGVFVKILTTFDTPLPNQQYPCILLSDLLKRLTQVFRFAQRFGDRVAPAGSIEVKIRLANIGNRRLYIKGAMARTEHATKKDELFTTWKGARSEMQDPDVLAVKAAFWFCERFNCDYVGELYLTTEQARFLHQL